MVFCPKCGKKGVKGLCEDCKPVELLDSYKEKMVEFCQACSKVNIRGKWVECRSLKEGFSKVIRDRTKCADGVKLDVHAHLEQVPIKPGIRRVVQVDIKARLGSVVQESSMLVRLLITSCPKCSKMGTQYLEGILQLRGITKETEFVIDFARNEIAKLREKGMFINKEKRHKDGIDLVVTRKKCLRQISQKIVDEFGGTVSFNTQVFSMDRQTMKDILRLNVLVTLPDIFKGAVVSVGRALFVVRSTKGKEVNCIDLSDGKKKSFMSDRREYGLVCRRRDLLETSISKLAPHLEALHPETFESVLLMNEEYAKSQLLGSKMTIGKKIRVLGSNGLWFVSM